MAATERSVEELVAEAREYAREKGPLPNVYRPTDCDFHVDWDDRVAPRNALLGELADRLEALDKHHTLVCHDREKIWQEREEARAALEAEHAARREAEAERDALRQVMNGMHMMPIAKYDRLRRVVDAARAYRDSFKRHHHPSIADNRDALFAALDSAEETKP
jgi:hypothetical protein